VDANIVSFIIIFTVIVFGVNGPNTMLTDDIQIGISFAIKKESFDLP